MELPITSTSDDNVDLYADELEQFLLLHQENQEIPEALTSAGQLGASNINQCVVTSKKVNKFQNLQQQLLMLDEDHEILENSREDFPAPRSAAELGTFPLG